MQPTLRYLLGTCCVAIAYAHTQPVPATTNKKIQKIDSVRGVLGRYDLIEHTKGQLRAGYITFKQTDATRTRGYAVGGHIHFDTSRLYGMKLEVEAYGVVDVARLNPSKQNGDFFDSQGNGFATLSQAFLDGKWDNTQLRLGRQTLDTPLADSDDIRMMPNYFQAYTLAYTGIASLTLQGGYIEKMAGWENGIDASQFIAIADVLGASNAMDGVVFVGATYEGIADTSLNAWYYRYDDVADIVYVQGDYHIDITSRWHADVGVQYAYGRDQGKALLGQKEASTWGVMVQLQHDKSGLTLTAAYNRDNGQTGAVDLSLGGGPFFTSMEDLTVDAIAGEGSAWTTVLNFDFGKAGIDGLIAAVAYALFRSDTPTNHFHAYETDVIIQYAPSDRITLTGAYAAIDHRNDAMADYDQFRLIANYNF